MGLERYKELRAKPCAFMKEEFRSGKKKKNLKKVKKQQPTAQHEFGTLFNKDKVLGRFAVFIVCGFALLPEQYICKPCKIQLHLLAFHALMFLTLYEIL